MDDKSFYETILDNISDGIYILDACGNYIYANSHYINSLGINKSTLLTMNVHDFLDNGQISICISDIVYKQKQRVVMFQDVVMSGTVSRPPFRQLVISTPIFGEDGRIQNILAVCRPLNTLNDFIDEASTHEVALARRTPRKMSGTGAIVAESQTMRNVLWQAAEIAGIDASVLITGESGTGKEVIAQHIHSLSRSGSGEMVSLNCAALPENLLESELFGYERGAFTGALSAGKAGLFEMASGGTLFLDEINSLPLPIQGKLLRAVETKTIQRIGSVKSKKVDFRLITASNENLLEAVADKRFRADLYYRINVVPIELPPLRSRQEDIIPLTLFFLQRYNEKYGKNKRMAEHTLQAIYHYDWPGNVRELKNFVERSVIMSATDQIDILDIGLVAASHGRPRKADCAGRGLYYPPVKEDLLEQGLSLQEYMDRCERAYLAQALQKYRTTYVVAEKLQTSQSGIMRRKKKYGL
ncbi:MAG: sigma 54-interacting transcriptional regulator [Oscillibacter sp.]|nr:sigma 54-interacting transcriptional regulator [Oscillibacter sp.]